MPVSITVYVIDGDDSVRRALARVIRAVGIRPVCVKSIEGLLQHDLPASRFVLLVDAETDRQSGTSLQETLRARGLNPPVIYLTDCDTDQGRCKVWLSGAAGYFRKPIDDQALTDAIFFAAQDTTACRSANV